MPGRSLPGVYELTPNAGLEGKPPGFLPALGPQWGQVTPWGMTSADQFLPPPPPTVDSPEYAAAFNEVKLLGATNSVFRTSDETLFAHFWADVPGHSVTPPGHWDEIAEHLALQANLSLEENAHLFALLNIGLADAADQLLGCQVCLQLLAAGHAVLSRFAVYDLGYADRRLYRVTREPCRLKRTDVR